MARVGDERTRSFVEVARRRQLVDVTIAQLAEHGARATTLQRIATAAGLTKGAVLYHFASKDAVVTAAYERVLGELVEAVGAAVSAADPVHVPAAYVRAMVAHLHANPSHVRMIVEGVEAGIDDHEAHGRWAPFAALVAAAADPGADARAIAITIGGGIDAIVAERMRDGTFDSLGAAELLVAMLEAAMHAPGGRRVSR